VQAGLPVDLQSMPDALAVAATHLSPLDAQMTPRSEQATTADLFTQAIQQLRGDEQVLLEARRILARLGLMTE
jgi:antitoxin component of RelBE/YafQ-DinJ toxin-antitoxin module